MQRRASTRRGPVMACVGQTSMQARHSPQCALVGAVGVIQWFGNQGLAKSWMAGASIYGAPGIVMAEIFALFPILDERRHQQAGTMSGGQQQMVAVGRALMALPRVLALDEPSLGLAPIMVDRLFEGIRKIRNIELAVLVIEQNVQMVLNMADHGFVIENGTIAGRSQQVRCPGCGYTYDEALGDPREGFPAGTSWAAVPEDWCCPECGAGKGDYDLIDG